MDTVISIQIISQVNLKRNLPNRFYYQENIGRWPCRVFPSHLYHYRRHRCTMMSITINYYPKTSCVELNMEATDKNGSKIGSTSCWLKGEKMKDEYRRKSSIRLASRDGVDFWNRMIASLNYKLHSTLPDQLTDYMKRKIFDRSTHFIRPEFHWENVGGTHRLKIDNEGITNSDYKILSENAFFIHLDIAEAFNFVIPKKGTNTNGGEIRNRSFEKGRIWRF